MNSRAKGARGEREFRDELRAQGFEARRGQQFAGGTDSPDVVCPSLPSLHFEVKRVQSGNPYNWLKQAIRDACGKLAIVAHKRNHHDWMVIMSAADFFKLLRESSFVDNSVKKM